MQDISLKNNPFAILRVSPRAKIAEIEVAFEDAVINQPTGELSLLKTKQLLFTPNARLIAELSWLSEVAPSRAERLIAMLDLTDAAGLLQELPDLPPLSSANLAAEATSRLGDMRFIPPLISAHERINRDLTLMWLNSTRVIAGFARVEGSQLDDALRGLLCAHARAAVGGIVAQEHPAQALSSLITPESDPHVPIIKEIFREYDHWASPHLGQIERDINSALADLLACLDGAGDRVSKLLAAWDEVSQPAQLYCQLSGLDEERSLRVYRLVRGHCVDLANDHQRFDDAYTIATTMRNHFKNLPTATSELESDIGTLARLSVNQKIEQALAPLSAAITSARANVGQVASELKASGFADRTGGFVAPLYRAFVQSSHVLSACEHADAPIRLVRSFALDLNNEHDDPAAAAALLSGLAQVRAPVDRELADQLATDIRVTTNNRDHRLFTQAIAGKHLDEAIRILDMMVARTPPGDDAVQLRALRDGLNQKRTKRYINWGGWGVAAAFVAYLVSQGGGGTSSVPSTYSPATSQYSSGASPSAPPAPDTPAPDANAVPSADAPPAESPPTVPDPNLATDVTVPPVGTDLELDASQVRYCTFEKARLTTMKDLISQTNSKAIDGFNTRVDDYNSRCGSFRYHASDLDAAKLIAERDADRFVSEARTIAENWNQ